MREPKGENLTRRYGARKGKRVETTVLVDGDPIVYSHGFAAQRREFYIIAENEQGELQQFKFEGKSALNEWRKANPTVEPLSLDEQLIVEPEHHIFATVKATLGALESYGTPRVFLSGEGNYRHTLAKFNPYKANRDSANRPILYDAVRRYLIEQYDATVVSGIEADDALRIEAHKLGIGHYVIATVDKDLDQIPGKHYDFRKRVEYWLHPEDSLRAFWIQALAGDPVDTVPGCYKVGQVKAEKFIDALMGDEVSDKGIWQGIVGKYELSTRIDGCPYTEEQAPAVALETAQLVYVQRNAGELWMPPGQEFGVIPQ